MIVYIQKNREEKLKQQRRQIQQFIEMNKGDSKELYKKYCKEYLTFMPFWRWGREMIRLKNLGKIKIQYISEGYQKGTIVKIMEAS